jgi:hypothetical protein
VFTSALRSNGSEATLTARKTPPSSTAAPTEALPEQIRFNIIITFRNFPFVPYNFAYFPNGRLCFFGCHLPQNREKHEHPFSVTNFESDKTFF